MKKINKEILDMVEHSLLSLDGDELDVFILLHNYGMTVEDIAEELYTSVEQVEYIIESVISKAKDLREEH